MLGYYISKKGTINSRDIETPNVFLKGSNNYAFTLLYNHNIEIIKAIANSINQPEDTIVQAIQDNDFPPVRKINFAAMPVQDALDFAGFLVKVQIVMERFVPGTPLCGGPIDLAVVHGLPKNTVTWLPGKQIHYPEI
jgi:hypothetical protein